MHAKCYYLVIVLLILAGCTTTGGNPSRGNPNGSWQEISSSNTELNNSGQVTQIKVTQLARTSQDIQQSVEVLRVTNNTFDDYRVLEEEVMTNSAGEGQVTQTLLSPGENKAPSDLVVMIDDGVSRVYAYANRFIVRLKPGNSDTIDSLSTTHQFKLIKSLGVPNVLLIQTNHLNLRSRQEWKTQLIKENGIEHLEDDTIVFINSTVPNETSFSLLWGLHNTGQTGGATDADIDAPEAWDLSTGKATVTVGIIDTGVDYNHPDLQQNMFTNAGEMGFDQNGLDKRSNAVDDDNNGYVDDWRGWDFANNDNDPMDDHYHGTHVAGTVGAVGNNGSGVTGTAWTVKLVALKFLRADGSGSTADAIEALNYAARMGFDLTNNSWGGGGFSQELFNAINANLAADTLFVAAAGNSGRDNDVTPHYPSSYDLANVISVAATDHNDQLAVFSNYGKTSVDLAAPGVAIYSTRPGSPQYTYLNGTSMATPHVSGVAALIKSENPSMNFQQIKLRLFRGSEQKSSLVGKMATGARLNAYQSLLPYTSNEAPVGSVMVFGGPSYLIPDNWQICDGSLVTDPASPLLNQNVPDLRDRFIMGASAQAPLNSTGGNNALKAHGHQFSAATNNVLFGIKSGNGSTGGYNPATSADGFDRSLRNLNRKNGATNPYDTHGHMNGTAIISGRTGGGGAQDNRPAYTALHYIIRIK